MSKPKVKHRIKVWVITWPKGTTEEYKDTPIQPVDYLPISAEPYARFEYYDKKEKRAVYGAPVAVFTNRDEAIAYEASQGNSFIVRPAYLEVL